MPRAGSQQYRLPDERKEEIADHIRHMKEKMPKTTPAVSAVAKYLVAHMPPFMKSKPATIEVILFTQPRSVRENMGIVSVRGPYKRRKK